MSEPNPPHPPPDVDDGHDLPPDAESKVRDDADADAAGRLRQDEPGRDAYPVPSWDAEVDAIAAEVSG